MKRMLYGTVLMLCVISLTSVATASVPYGYLNGSFQKNQPTGDFGDANEGNAIGGWGGELSAGIMSDVAEFYLGHRWSDFSGDGDGGPQWKAMDRWVVGLRWLMIGDLNAPFTPLIGGGLTMGDAEMERRVDPDDPDSKMTMKSRNDVGWFLEAGAELRFPGRIAAIGAVQYHRFDTNFDNAIFEDPNFKIEYLTFMVGMNIRLGGPSM